MKRWKVGTVKRAIDIVGSGLALVLLLPAMLAVALAVRWRMGSPVLFTQQRPGLSEVPFTIYKFRTMQDGTAADEARLTTLGKLLRATSLDELPELWNVLRGDMSLVGPRPLLMEYLGHYSAEQQRRHEVRPGITGWAQVCGRNNISWDEKLRLDVWYVEHRSLWLDFKILLMTPGRVLSRQGVSKSGHATTDRFTDTTP